MSIVFSSLAVNHTCSSNSMARLKIRDKFVINGDEEPVTVGDNIEVTCKEPIQLFTKV